MSIEHSAFDTEVLGLSVAKINGVVTTQECVKNLLAEASQKNIDLLFWSLPAASGDLLQCVSPEILSVTAKVLLSAEPNRSLVAALSEHTGVKEVHVNEFQGTAPTPELIELSVASGQYSRFARDPNLSPGQCRSMFTRWIENSVNKQVADVVFLASRLVDGVKQPQVAGMVTVRQRGSSASIELLAVSAEHRRKGVGSALLAKALAWCMSVGARDINVATQSDNHAAVRLYKACGFEPQKTTQDVHVWLGQGVRDEFADRGDLIPNCQAFLSGRELEHVQALLASRDIRTHSKYGNACQAWLERELRADKVLLVGSGTQALELCSLLVQAHFECDLRGEYEIIMPSYTFVSTANAFLIHGATPVFVDIRSDTQNIDETKIEAAVRPGVTRAISVVHYAGVPCEMDTIMDIANRHNLLVVEDNAHGIFSTYKGKLLGTIGHLGAFSFHYTKNFVAGEGGAVAVNCPGLIRHAMVAYEKGTNRFDFLQGRISKYAWVTKGGSFPMSEIAAAVLLGQLETRDAIQCSRLRSWQFYHDALENLELEGKLRRPAIPKGCTHNAHIYYIRVPKESDFKRVVQTAGRRNVSVFTHYEPLHNSAGGQKFGRTSGTCSEVQACANQLLRLPMWAGLTGDMLERVIAVVYEAFDVQRQKRARVA